MKNALLLFCTIISIASISKYNTFEPPVVATATVNLTNVKQDILFMGGDMERSANAVQDAANKTQIIQWGFGDIPFNICRMQYDKNQEMVEGVKNFGF